MRTPIARKSETAQIQLLKDEPGLMPLLKVGDLVQVTLLERANRAVYFDVPQVGTGVIYGMELTNAKDILRKLSPGDTATAKVVLPENDEGLIELSLAEAGRQKVWQEVRELKDRDESVTVKIVSVNSGGLIADLNGLQAFLPTSQLGNKNYPRDAEGDKGKIILQLQKFVGTEMTVKILGLNPRTNKLIISEQEVATENVKELLLKYQPGDVVSGIVTGVANFGAFVRFADNPEIEGLIHISELDHRLIENPKEVVKIGDLVQAKIIEIKDGRVSLSLKALKPDPWQKIEERFTSGGTAKGTVYKVTPFGAFIKLTEDILGLIHVSEFGSLEELKKNLEKDKSYNFLIDSVKPEDKRIVLKLIAKEEENPANQ